MKIYNTFTRKKEEFKPIVDGHVGIYVCGPTVYGMPHLGHAKSYINFDTIIRYFRFLGYKVKYVQNITDVGHLVGDGDEGEDKIAKQAKLEQLDPYEIAYKYEVAYFDSMDKLNILRPSVSARATGFVMEMIEIIKTILDKGFAYVTDRGNVYFDVRKYSKYGQLSNRTLDKNISGERIEVADDKHSPEDFALWKAVDETVLMQWPSPWGNGCPGWHIECTTLGKKFLGEKFDIHGGGIDNMFPHHECECAQADVALGHIPMNYFMHNGLVTVNGTKMGKSLGNSMKLENLFNTYGPMPIRYFIEQFHYRSNVDFSDEGLRLAKRQFEKLKSNVWLVRSKTTKIADNLTDPQLIEIYDNFVAAMNEDFNTPVAMAEFNKINKFISSYIDNASVLSEVNYVIKRLGEDALGLDFGTADSETKDDIPEAIKSKAEVRWQAKLSRDWTTADALRKELLDQGYEIKDSKDSYEIIKL